MDIEKRVKEILEKEINKIGVTIDSVIYEKEDNNYFLRIIIDSEEVVDIDTCVKATKIINPILDKEDIIKGSYILDISSKERGDK